MRLGFQLRLGGLWAQDPWVVAGGLVGQLGGLAMLGLGLELAFEHLQGWFVNAGSVYSHQGEVVGYARAGFWLVGLEVQQRWPLSARSTEQAVLLALRLPLGLSSAVAKHAQLAQAARQAALEARRTQSVGTSPAVPAVDKRAVARLLTQAQRFEQGAQWVEAEGAYQESLRKGAGDTVWLDLSRVQEKRGHWVDAVASLVQYRTRTESTLSARARRALAERLAELRGRLPLVRLLPQGVRQGSERCRIDDEVCEGALRGSDCPVDPGHHRVRVERGDQLLFETTIEAQPGQIERLHVPLDPASAPAGQP